MKVRSNPGEFKLLKSNAIFTVALSFMLAISGVFLAFGKDYLYDNGKMIFTLTLVGFVSLAVYAFLRLQYRIAGLATELRRTSEEEEFERNRTLTLINSIKDAVIFVDDSGHVSLYNAATLDLLDTNVSISRQPVETIFKPAQGSAIDFKVLMANLKGSQTINFKNTLSDGKLVDLSLAISRARSGYGKIGMRGFVFVVKRSSSVDNPDSEEAHLERHALRNSWAIIEGSIENAQLMLSRDNIDGAKKAIDTAVTNAAQVKEKIL